MSIDPNAPTFPIPGEPTVTPKPSPNTSLIIVEDQPPFIGAPPFLGRQIKTLHDLESAATSKRAVVVFMSGVDYYLNPKPRPAAYVLNQNGGTILNMIKTGLYIYIPTAKAQRPKRSNGKEEG